jgi:signal transduction histidine kinase
LWSLTAWIIRIKVTERKQAEENLRRAKADLETRVQERTKELALRASQLRALAGEITISEQRERKRLASFLHDHLQQLLVGAKFRLSVLRKAGDDGIKLVAKEIEAIVEACPDKVRDRESALSGPSGSSGRIGSGCGL